MHENQLLAACGDGSVKLFDTSADNFPIQNFHEHKREVYAVSWNQITKDTFLSSSWDGTIKIVRSSPNIIYLRHEVNFYISFIDMRIFSLIS